MSAVVLSRLARVALLLLICACGKKPASSGTPPSARSLGAGPLLAAADTPSGPVRVTYFAPIGETEGQVELNVSFDRPMVALGTEDGVAEGVLELEPKVAGRARWVGSQTLLFEPSAPLPMATDFTVRVAKSLRALDGEELAEALSFGFSTPALQVVRSDPSHGAVGETKQRPIELFFNQRVSAEELRAHAKLSYVSAKKRTPTPLELTVDRPDPTDPGRLRITPKKAYPLAAEVTLQVRAGLRSEEGPRALVQDFVSSFQVYGPLRLLTTPACSGEDCYPRLVFSNPVANGAARARLRFEPALPRPLESQGDWSTDELYFGDELAPNTTYRVRVEGELRDVYGNTLEGERTTTLRTPPYPSLARWLISGDLMATPTDSQVSPLRAQLQNLKDARLELVSLSADEVFPTELESLRPRNKPVVHALGAAGPTERRNADVDPRALLKNGKGLLLASLLARGQGEPQQERRLIAFTDLAPTLKASSRGGMVWLTRLSDATPVADASVRVVRGLTTVATGKTDGKGMFAFTLPAPVAPSADSQGEQDDPNGDLSVVVQKGDDISFARKFAGVGPWELSERGSYSADGPTSAHLFTERGIYRPGDTLQLKGILRSHDGKSVLPAEGEVQLRVLDASESEVERGSASLSRYGTFVKSVRIPGSVELGPLTLQVTHGAQRFTETVEVAEYRPAELELSLRADRELALRGQKVFARLSGQYLFGAPAKGARVYWSTRFVDRAFAPATHPDFVFHDEDDGGRDQVSDFGASGEGVLDERGELGLEAALRDAPLTGPSSMQLETSVVLDNTQAATRTSVDVVPANVLAGLRTFASVSQSEQPLELSLVALTPQAAPKSGVWLDATLDRRVFTTEVVDGVRQRVQHDERVGSCRRKSEATPVSCHITPPLPGLHVARVRAKDAQGRVSTAARWVYVAGAGQASWGEDSPVVLALKSDRTSYKLGETAKVLVPSPFAEAEALVTVEREGVLSAERVKVGPASTLDIRVDERFVPNAFVSVLLVRPLSASKTPDELDFRVGSLELSADVSSRRLTVDVVPDAEEKRPGGELSLQLAVRDGTGKATQAELTVFAVDEGVLALTGYRTPDPFASIYAPRALAVWTSDARGSLARLLAGDGDEKGGDEGGGGGEVVRSNFASVALFLPNLETDAEGKASVRFKLPDSTTRFRIMAVAAARGAEVGAGEAAVRTKKPLMLRPQLPRVLRAGDQLSAAVVVHNEQEQAVDAELALTVSGLTLRDAPRQRLHIPAHAAVEARYAVQAGSVGEARLSFVVEAGAERDAIVATRRVLSPSVAETVSLGGLTEARVQQTLAPLSNVRDDVGGLDLSLSTSALAELEAPARALLAYEYGCTEQLASRLVALSALQRLQKPLALDDTALAPLVASIASELERHQRGDGGFGMWSAADATPPALSAYLTGYALLTFQQLHDAGFAVSAHAPARARAFLASTLRADGALLGDGGTPAGSLEERAFVVYALARSGAYDPAYAGKLYELRGQLSVLARLELAHALLYDPQRKDAVETLLRELSGQVRVSGDQAHLEHNRGDGYAAQFMSDVRASAELLLLLLAHDADHVLVPKLARWLSESRARDGSWRSTQETAWGLMAMSAYLARKEPATPDMNAQLQLGTRVLGPTALSGHRAKASFHVPMRELPRAGELLAVQKSGAGTLHYALRLTYASATLPSTPVERGFFVERSYERIEPGALARGEVAGTPGNTAKVGDYVRVTLRIAVPSARSLVLIHDPLPAGLEAVDFTLATELTGAARALRSSGPRDHQELRDDRAVFAVNDLPPGLYRYSYLARASSVGVFVVPPARVEEMYHPETSGQTAAHSFTVQAP
jgi:uncharacterized protein YfaS (alpha-2-macroglobulin family)